MKMDPKRRTTVRNLRIREDTPKYLRNLSLTSAHYDPKSRTMRDNPYPDKNPEDVAYAGDNFTRYFQKNNPIKNPPNNPNNPHESF